MSYSSDNELINKDGTVDKLIVLDRLTKKKVVKDVNELIIRIYKNIKNDEEREIIENYIRSTLSELITSEQLDEIIKKVNKEEGGEGSMLRQTIIEMIEDGRKEGEKKGRKEGNESGISQVAINMLKQKYKKEEIKKCTGLSYVKIAKLEKSLQSV